MTQELVFPSGDQIILMDKSEIAYRAKTFAESMEGMAGLKSASAIAKFQLMLAELEKNFKDITLAEIRKHQGGKVSAFGIDFAEMESGVKYDYSANQIWNDLQDKIDHLKAQQKDVEAFCKSLKSPTVTVDPETGESFEWFPPSKSSTTTIKKTIK